MSARPHVPERPVPSVTSHSVTAAPPDESSRFSLPLAKNAIERLSGDQKTDVAPSVAGSTRASRLWSGRSHTFLRFVASVAMKASCEPLGDRARLVVSRLSPTDPAPEPLPKTVPGGGEIVNRTTFAGDPNVTAERNHPCARIAETARVLIPTSTSITDGRAAIE